MVCSTAFKAFAHWNCRPGSKLLRSDWKNTVLYWSSHLSFSPLSPPVFLDAQPSLYLTCNLVRSWIHFWVSSKELQNRSTITTCPNLKPPYMLQQAAQLIKGWPWDNLDCLVTRANEEPLGLISPLTIFHYSCSPLLLPTIRILGFCVLVGFSVLLFTDTRPHYVSVFWNTVSWKCQFYIL